MRQAKDDSEIPGTVAYEAARADRLQARIEALEAALHYVADMTYCGADAEWHFRYVYDPQVILDALAPRVEPQSTQAADRIEALEAALREIARGEGRFSRDPYEHACNTIEDLIAIARAALAPEQDKSDG
jgi:hypothetical protein